MNIQTKQLKPSEAELNIEVSQEECRPFLEKAANRLSQTSKIEGFRPGKAPYDIIKQRLGEMAIYQEALDAIISFFYFQAVKRENLDTVSQPKIDLEKLAPGNPIIFKATAALMPQIKLGHYQSIRVKKGEVKIEAREIEKVIEDIRKMQAKESLQDKTAENGDRAEIDFNVNLNNVPIENGQGKKYPLVIGDGAMVPGFEEQLIGLKKDEEKSFQLKFPDEYQNKMVAGKLCDFKVRMLAVFKRELPEISDEWAKTVGAENLEDLKSKIKKNLEDEKMFHEEQRQELEMLNKIVAQTELSEIPDVLIDSEAHRMVHEFEDSIEQQGIKFEEYLNNIKKEEKDLEADFKAKALERVKTSLVIKEIADKENIIASEEELKKETEKILTQVRGNKEAEENIWSEGYQRYLKTVVRNRKTVEMLKSLIICE